MSSTVNTEKHRVLRRFFDHATGRTYDTIASIPGRRTIDARALGVFLRIGYVPGHGTLFEGVDCLPGGCVIEVDANGWRVKWRFRFAELEHDLADRRAPRAELVASGARKFVEAVAARFRDADRIVVPLSGDRDVRREYLHASLHFIALSLGAYVTIYGDNAMIRCAPRRNGSRLLHGCLSARRAAVLAHVRSDKVLAVFPSTAAFRTMYSGFGR